MAGADCGFSSQASYNTEVHPTVVWASSRRCAKERGWRRNNCGPRRNLN